MSGHQREVGEPGTVKAARPEYVLFFHVRIQLHHLQKKVYCVGILEDGTLSESILLQ